MTNKQDIEQAAATLYQAEKTGVPCAPVSSLFDKGDLETAYSVQEINTVKSLESGRRLVGRKIGLTSPVVQAQLGVDQPDYGMLFADMALGDCEEIDIQRVMQPKVEAEVALVLGGDLDQDHHTIADIIAATDFALPCIEIVGSRIQNWEINIVDTIADNASSGCFVLGSSPRHLSELDLRLCGMVLDLNGEPASTGAGQACLGNPLNAARWLADAMKAACRPLQAGDTILTGALGPMVSVAAGDNVSVRINGLGTVSVQFTGGV